MSPSMKNTLIYVCALPFVIVCTGLWAGAGVFSFLAALAVNFTAHTIIQSRKKKSSTRSGA